MNKSNIRTLEIYGETYIKNLKKVPDEKVIRSSITQFRPIVPNVTSEEVEEAIKNLEKRYYITMDSGVVLRNKETYKKWYFNSQSKRGTSYWDRYQRYLLEEARMPSQVVDKIGEAADEIMDSLADPQLDTNFSRKGLVIGAVQSGKTSNYIALMNKATDSGYKVIILLTGTIEKLRRQTQVRVDEGFSGSDSKAQTVQKKNVWVGVGKYAEKPVTSYTRTDKDFSIQEAIKIEDQRGPVVFVIKKNKSILERLENWLKQHNRNPLTGMIESPLLLIDDEADNASVNTAQEDRNPTIINQKIRNILKLFSKSSYVGFTATPFANIFIDPQFESKEGDDLFPRDFISLLEQPSDYVGPNDMYHEQGIYHYMIRNNNDVEHILPLSHKNGSSFHTIPESLKDAIMIFFIANAIRDIRGHEKTHRSMLIHISRFIIVQNNIKEKIDAYVKELKREIKHYILVPNESDTIKRFKHLYEKEFSSSDFDGVEKKAVKETWDQIQEIIFESVMPIQVKVVNSGNAAKDMNYDDYEDGLRIIAIGGLSLARGLTLEGLMTSYFYRNTKMYDTLMQMGRWFGYRFDYEDLCRLWTSSESADWYAHIADATEELRWEIKKMAAQNKKPIEFGLKVRSAEDAPLIITAKNKMRATERIRMHRSLNGQMIETAILSKNMDDNEANYQVINDWLNENNSYNVSNLSDLQLKKPTLKNVPKDNVIQLLDLLNFPLVNDIKSITSSIKTSKSLIFDKWDIVINSIKNKDDRLPTKYGSFDVYPSSHQFDLWGTQGDVRLSGSNKRMGSVDNAKGGLTIDQFRLIERHVRKQREDSGKNKRGELKRASENMYFNTGISRNPLIVIYPVFLKETDKDLPNKKEINDFAHQIEKPLTGIAIGIPDINNVENVIYEYEINVVMQRERLGLPVGSIDEDDEFYADDEDDESLME